MHHGKFTGLEHFVLLLRYNAIKVFAARPVGYVYIQEARLSESINKE